MRLPTLNPSRLLNPLLLILLLPTVGVAQASETFRSWNVPVKPYRVIGNIYYVGANEITSFLITTPQGHILIDSGFQETVPIIRDSVRKLGFRFEDIKILLNTQAHIDHAGGLSLTKQLTGARLMASEQDAALIANGGKGDFRFGDELSYQPATTERIIRDGDRVTLGGVTLTAHLTPGHTKGCTTWTMTVKEGKRKWNVVFVGSTTINEGVRLLDNPAYPNIADDYARTFRTLKALDCDVFLASHASFYSMAEKMRRMERGAKTNPFIDPKGYRAFLAETEATYLKQLRQEQEAKAKR